MSGSGYYRHGEPPAYVMPDEDEEYPPPAVVPVETAISPPEAGTTSNEADDQPQPQQQSQDPHDVDKEPQEQPQQQQEEQSRKRFTSIVLIEICLVILLLAGFAVIIARYVQKDNNNNNNNNPSTTKPTSSHPTASPPVTTVTPVPTSSASTISPTIGQSRMNPFIGETGSGLGSSLVYSSDTNLVVAGAPLLGTGTIQTFWVIHPNNNDNNNSQSTSPSWVDLGTMQGDTIGGAYGTSLGLTNTMLVVGAPHDVSSTATTRQQGGGRGGASGGAVVLLDTIPGVVYVYQFSNNNNTTGSVGGTWNAMGPMVTATLANASPNSNFGAAVAISSSSSSSSSTAATMINPLRMVVGAPYSTNSQGISTGQAYLFEYSGTQWNLVNLTVVGTSENDGLGSSVAMSKDGSAFMVGAPGVGNMSNSIGYAYMYQYNASSGIWKLAFALGGIDAQEGFGSYVGILSNTGNVIALGGPGNNNGSGYVLVYNQGLGGLFSPLGNGIYGKPGDRIGEKGTVSGGTDMNGTTHVILTTASGEVQRYDYNNSTQQWEQTYGVVQTGYMGGTTVADGGNAGNWVVVGNAATDRVALYQQPLLNETGPPTEFFNANPPTSAPSLKASSPSLLTTTAPSSSSTGTTTSPIVGITASPSVGGGVGATTSAPTPATALEAPTVMPLLTSTPSLSSVNTTTTTAPTLANLKTWTLTGGPLTLSNIPNSGFGSAVALSSSLLAVGAPFESSGTVITYLVQNGTTTSTMSQQFNGDQANAAFGYAVGVSELSLLVGAPFEYVNQTTVAGGAAYYYSSAGSADALNQVGGILRCYNGIYAANEQCGASVATSANQIVVLGAPGNSLDGKTNRGAFYIQQYSGSAFAVVAQGTGMNAKDGLGQAVDISSDGSVVLVGAPGGNYALIYEVSSSGTWTNSFKIDTTDTSENLGTSVKVSSTDYVAVGAPGYGGGSGRIAVYERVSSSWMALPNLVGATPSDSYGATNSLTGSDSTVIVTSITGQVVRYDYLNGSWQQTATTLQLAGTIADLESTNNGQTLVTGTSNGQVSIYTLM